MDQEATAVLKRDKIREGQRRLIGGGSPRANVEPVRTRARIVEQDDTHAVIEVICDCGRKCYVNCAHEAPTGQKGGPGSAQPAASG